MYLQEDRVVPCDVEVGQGGKVKGEVEQVTGRILGEDFEAAPSYDECRNCPYRDICDRKETELL